MHTHTHLLCVNLLLWIYKGEIITYSFNLIVFPLNTLEPHRKF